MDLKTLIREGRLEPALEQATAAVKAAPTDAPSRTALFELLCFAGDLERAEKQLQVLSSESIETAYGATLMNAHLKAERQRREVFGGKAQPDFLDEDAHWAKPRLDILAGNPSLGADELEKARATPRGRINGKDFRDLRDGDDLLAPLLELFVAGRYVWVAWTQIRSLTSEPPKSFRDTLWMPVKLTLSDGKLCEGSIPVLYFGSHEAADDNLRLGLATDWEDEGGLVRGKGRRLLYADGDEQEVLAMRELEIAD